MHTRFITGERPHRQGAVLVAVCTVALIVASTFLHRAQAKDVLAPQAKFPRVFETALVERAPGSPTAFITLCKTCKRMTAKMTPQTKIFQGDAKTPLPSDIDVHADTELMYDPKTKSILWLWIR